MQHRASRRSSALGSMLLWLSVASSAQAPAGSIAPLLGRSRAYLEANDVTRARAAVDQAIQRDPESGEAYFLRGLIAERENDVAAAAAAYPTAVRFAPRLAEAHDGSGSCSAARVVPRKRSPSSSAPPHSRRRCSTPSIISAPRAGGPGSIAGAKARARGGSQAAAEPRGGQVLPGSDAGEAGGQLPGRRSRSCAKAVELNRSARRRARLRLGMSLQAFGDLDGAIEHLGGSAVELDP